MERCELSQDAILPASGERTRARCGISVDIGASATGASACVRESAGWASGLSDADPVEEELVGARQCLSRGAGDSVGIGAADAESSAFVMAVAPAALDQTHAILERGASFALQGDRSAHATFQGIRILTRKALVGVTVLAFGADGVVGSAS